MGCSGTTPTIFLRNLANGGPGRCSARWTGGRAALVSRRSADWRRATHVHRGLSHAAWKRCHQFADICSIDHVYFWPPHSWPFPPSPRRVLRRLYRPHISKGRSMDFFCCKTEDGKVIAVGDQTSIVRGDEVRFRLIFHFRDGSIDDETATFRQGSVFQLISGSPHPKRAIVPPTARHDPECSSGGGEMA